MPNEPEVPVRFTNSELELLMTAINHYEDAVTSVLPGNRVLNKLDKLAVKIGSARI